MSRIVITLGEPAGIGPDLGVLLAEKHLNKNTIIIDRNIPPKTMGDLLDLPKFLCVE